MRDVAVALGLLFALAATAQASEQSEALTARGLVEFHEGRAKEAMEYFDRAVATDPQDAAALYQRAVALAKDAKYEQAIADLKQALAIRPDMDEAALELGAALVELNRNGEARPWLVQAQRRPDLDGQASFFLGIADLREGHLDEARTNFERAREKDPSVEVSSRYYLGVVEYRAGRLPAAQEHFAFVQQQAPQSAVGRESVAFLDIIRGGQVRDTQVYGGLSTQYDTNVILAPAAGTPQQAISNQADGRVTINAGGIWIPWRSERARLSVGYDFYQNLQFQLHSFNLQDHRPTVAFSYDFGPVRAGALAQYDFYLRDTDTFLQQVTASPWLIIPEKQIGRTEIYLRFEWIDYLEQSFAVLDGYDYAGGIRQVFALNDDGAEAWIGYQAEAQDTTNGEFYAFDANQIETAINWPLPWTSSVQVAYRYRREIYANASAGFAPAGDPRLDRESRAGVSLRKDLNAYVALVASWIGTFNVSNKTEFEYNRQIGSLGVEVRY